MGLNLKEFLGFDEIVIQCHDNPDADALASGYALWCYLTAKGKNPRFIYSGSFPVTKSNLVLMNELLHIPVEYVKKLDHAPELLVTVDCRYGEKNVTKFEAQNVAVIDHHQISGPIPEMSEIRSNYGACSTILWDMLLREGFKVNENEDLATALYYGLMTDTNMFTEIHHPADKDLRDDALFRNSYITMFRNRNLSLEELKIAGIAMKHAINDSKYRYAIVGARPCDPNILGIISDMLLEVDSCDTCLVFSVLPFGVKFSVRSCVVEVQASELAAYIAEGIGGGGGHLVKAGGFLERELLERLGVTYDLTSLEEFLQNRLRNYFTDTEIIRTEEYEADLSKFEKYVKLPVEHGYVRSEDLDDVNSQIIIRTLEGDVSVSLDHDTYIIIGVEGEIWPISRKKFESNYELADGPYQFRGEYSPSVIDSSTGLRIELLPHAWKCVANGGSEIYARELKHRTKVFTSWDAERYYLGKPGDILAARVDDPKDVYIIERRIFEKTYRSRQKMTEERIKDAFHEGFEG